MSTVLAPSYLIITQSAICTTMDGTPISGKAQEEKDSENRRRRKKHTLETMSQVPSRKSISENVSYVIFFRLAVTARATRESSHRHEGVGDA